MGSVCVFAEHSSEVIHAVFPYIVFVFFLCNRITRVIHAQQESEEELTDQIVFCFSFCNRMKIFRVEAGRHINLVTVTFGDLPGAAWCLEVIGWGRRDRL